MTLFLNWTAVYICRPACAPSSLLTIQPVQVDCECVCMAVSQPMFTVTVVAASGRWWRRWPAPAAHVLQKVVTMYLEPWTSSTKVHFTFGKQQRANVQNKELFETIYTFQQEVFQFIILCVLLFVCLWLWHMIKLFRLCFKKKKTGVALKQTKIREDFSKCCSETTTKSEL